MNTERDTMTDAGSSRIGRRTVLTSLATACFAFVKSPVAAAARLTRDRADTSAHRLTAIFRDRRCARSIGAEYIRGCPVEADKRLLVSLMGEKAGPALPLEELRTEIQAQIRDDFTHGRVVQVQGWVLSCTEARLCALSTLS